MEMPWTGDPKAGISADRLNPRKTSMIKKTGKRNLTPRNSIFIDNLKIDDLFCK